MTPGPAHPAVWVILVNWNGRAVTLDCLASLGRVLHPALRVLVVDNASTDGSVDAIRAAHPGVEILQMQENLRFAGGNNAGMRHALAAGAERIVLLNNDTTVAPDFLEKLEARLTADPATGMVVPKIYYHTAPDLLWYAGGHISFWRGELRHAGIREPDRGQFDRSGDTEYATGCCVLVPRGVIDRAGMLDEGYVMYTEDADWSLRIRKAGFRVVYEPAARVWHKVSVSSGGHLSAFKLRHKLRSNIRFFVRHAAWYHWLTWPWAQVLANGLAAVRYLLRAR